MNSATIRTWHFYIGMFIAPSVLFFALTGALQLFSLHEAHGAYKPPAIIERLSSVHKDQVFAASHHHDHDHAEHQAKPPAAGTAPPPADDDDKLKTSTLVLKIFFFWAIAGGLIVSTLFGLWMGLTHPRRKRSAWITVAVGAAIPIVLLLI
jgi:hypothetical protein